MRRALVMFVEDPRHLIAESSWLYESWKHIGCGDTDLVFMGTEHALGQLPEDVIKIVQRPAADDPEWLGYRFINSLACLNGEGALVLNDYDRLLRTDLDVFLTPAWNSYDPAEFSTGRGHYSNDDCVRDNIRRVAHKYGLEHRGVFNVGSTMYGPPQLVREICDLATEVCKYIRTIEFKDEVGEWPSWFRGVSSMYAIDIAVNHLVPSFAEPSSQLDLTSSSTESVHIAAHIHCFQDKKMFSKGKCHDGHYDHLSETELNLDVIRDYCLAMALRAKARAPAQ